MSDIENATLYVRKLHDREILFLEKTTVNFFDEIQRNRENGVLLDAALEMNCKLNRVSKIISNHSFGRCFSLRNLLRK